MKADLFVQGHYWATIDVPGDSFFALLAKGNITQVMQKLDQLKRDLNSLDGVTCSISLRAQQPDTPPAPAADQDPQEEAP